MIVRAAKEDAEEIFNLHTETIEKQFGKTSEV
jgi:hypothetical protein